MNTDWTEWNGGECPVALYTPLEVKYRGGSSLKGFQAKEFRWTHTNHASDITAYRLAEQPTIKTVAAVNSSATPPKTETPTATQGPLIDLDHAISTAIQIALRRGVSVDSITALLTEINIEFKNARPYIQAALQPHQAYAEKKQKEDQL